MKQIAASRSPSISVPLSLVLDGWWLARPHPPSGVVIRLPVRRDR